MQTPIDYTSHQLTVRLANGFSAVIREWFSDSPDTLADIITRNKSNAPDECATDDFCDANCAMLEAWNKVFDLPRDSGPDTASEEQADLWSRAWGLAKAAQFEQIAEGDDNA